MAELGARLLGAGKLAAGVALVAMPSLTEQWLGKDARTTGGRALTRVFGIRDAMFGAGLLAAPNAGGELRRWLVFSSACDAVDFAAALGTRRSQGRSVMLAAAASATIAQLVMASQAEG